MNFNVPLVDMCCTGTYYWLQWLHSWRNCFRRCMRRRRLCHSFPPQPRSYYDCYCILHLRRELRVILQRACHFQEKIAEFQSDGSGVGRFRSRRPGRRLYTRRAWTIFKIRIGRIVGRGDGLDGMFTKEEEEGEEGFVVLWRRLGGWVRRRPWSIMVHHHSSSWSTHGPRWMVLPSWGLPIIVTFPD